MRRLSVEEAAIHLQICRRVLVIGCSGGGKSTLSQQLCSRFSLPYHSMDRDFFWLPGWVKREKSEVGKLIAETVRGERWLMDGTGSGSMDLRLPRADIVIWMRLPRWLCLWGAVSRGWRYRGRTRPDMAPGCMEQLPDREFLTYIWTFEQRVSPSIIRSIEQWAPECPVLIIESRGETARLLEMMRA